jgi:transposase
MALSGRIKVPLPDKEVIVRGTGKYRYVYKVLTTFRNEKGQPSNTRAAIGRLDEESGMLIPNDSYWEYFGDAVFAPGLTMTDPGRPFEVRSIGATFLVGRILESLGVAGILESVFGKGKASAVATAVIYMVCRGNVFEHVSGWHESCAHNEAPLTSPGSSSLFAAITLEERMAFFKEWVSRQADNEHLAYDVTSFSSYAAGVAETEWGHNRDKEKLPQINLGCFLGQKSGLPVFYVTYPGSIIDKSHLTYMMAYNEPLGVGNVCFVMDRGFCSTGNIGYMHGKKLPYVMGVEIGHKTTKCAINEARDGIVSMRFLVGADTYARSARSRFYGQVSSMHVFFNPDMAEHQRRDLYRTVESKEGQLGQLKRMTAKEAKHYRGHFNVTLAADGSFEYERNYRKIDDAAKDCGFFCILTNTDMGSEEVLSVYRRRDEIEKGFDDLKNHIDMKRLRTHSQGTTDGKVFCAFVALIGTLEMTNRLSGFMKEKSMSKDAVINEMEKIKIIFLGDGARLMNPVSKTQRTILELCGFSENDIKSYAGEPTKI